MLFSEGRRSAWPLDPTWGRRKRGGHGAWLRAHPFPQSARRWKISSNRVRALEGGEDIRIEVPRLGPSVALGQYRARGVMIEGWLVDPLVPEGVVLVRQGHDAAFERYLPFLEPPGVPRAVPAFVVRQGDILRQSQSRMVA